MILFGTHFELLNVGVYGLLKDGGTIMNTEEIPGQGRNIELIEKKTILVVDDVELFIQLQVSHLGKKKYNIYTAHSGTEGLQLARTQKPDLVLLDLFMPDLNGDEVCRTLKNDPATASIPVILVSSGSREISRSAMISSDCDGLVFKPVRKDLLVSVVENLLGTNLRLRERISVNIAGTVIHEGEVYPVTIRSLSSDGAFLELAREVTRGDMMEMIFTLPDETEEIRVRTAAVVWIGTLGETGPAGAGLSYLSIDERMRKRIDDFVRESIALGAVLSEN